MTENDRLTQFLYEDIHNLSFKLYLHYEYINGENDFI